LRRGLLIVYFLEAGLVLLIAPWSTFWERNLLVDIWPWFGGMMRLVAVRGVVSGVGIVNLWIGLADLWQVIRTLVQPWWVRADEADASGGLISSPPVRRPGEDTGSWT
jgi:hypothetical protein